MFMLVSKHLQLELQFLHFLICLVFTKRVSPAHKNWRRGDSWSIIPSPRLLRLCLGLLSAASLARWEIYRLGRGRSLHPGALPRPQQRPKWQFPRRQDETTTLFVVPPGQTPASEEHLSGQQFRIAGDSSATIG